MRKCKHCNATLKPDMLYCHKCGESVPKTNIDEQTDENPNTFRFLFTISVILAVLLIITAIFADKLFPLRYIKYFLGCMLISYLIHKKIIIIKKIRVKYIIISISLLLQVICISDCIENLHRIETPKKEAVIIPPHSVTIPCTSDSCKGKNYYDIRQLFSKAGFTDITTAKLEDLNANESEKNDTVETVTVGSLSFFDSTTAIMSDSPVVITYHTYKRVKLPYTNDNAKNVTPDELIQSFREAGFSNVIHEEVYDLNPDKTSTEFENLILVDSSEHFYSIGGASVDSEIKIITHRPFKKSSLRISIDFVPNLMFSKYDVSLEIREADTEEGKSALVTDPILLVHGRDSQHEVHVKPGKYELSFEGDSFLFSNEATVTINVPGDIEAGFRISCSNDKISVEQLYVEDKSAVGENQAMIPLSSTDCKNKNYKDIEKLFRNAGFTNISTDIIHDIVLGIVDEGSVERVSIDGVTDFPRGKILTKDADIVITYHMKEKKSTNTPSEKTNTISDKVSSEEKERPAYFSTNTLKESKKGNSGIFAYKTIGGIYDNYVIVDFTEKYVYVFSHGNGNESCDKLKFNTGDLNSKIIITYDDGNSTWSNGIHFKWKNQPDHLIVQDHNGFESDFYPTDLDDALKLRDKKTLHSY